VCLSRPLLSTGTTAALGDGPGAFHGPTPGGAFRRSWSTAFSRPLNSIRTRAKGRGLLQSEDERGRPRASWLRWLGSVWHLSGKAPAQPIAQGGVSARRYSPSAISHDRERSPQGGMTRVPAAQPQVRCCHL